MKIACYSFKGGVGKTTISASLALSTDFGIVTNDVYSPLEKVLPKERLLKVLPNETFPAIPEDWNIIYDLGGYADERVTSLLKTSDLIVVPTQKNFVDLKTTVATIKEIETFTKKIIVVVNRIRTMDEFTEAKNTLRNYIEYPVFPLKESKPLAEVVYTGNSTKQLKEKSSLDAYVHRNVISQMDDIQSFINFHFKN